MPYALIRDRFASAMIRSEPAGWNIPENLTGCPVSTPNGTMSSSNLLFANFGVSPRPTGVNRMGSERG